MLGIGILNFISGGLRMVQTLHNQMIEAATCADLESLATCLDNGADVNAKSDSGYTPLHRAAQLGHGPMAQLLLDKGADVNAIDAVGNTPLHWAVVRDNEAVVKLLLGAGGSGRER